MTAERDKVGQANRSIQTNDMQRLLAQGPFFFSDDVEDHDRALRLNALRNRYHLKQQQNDWYDLAALERQWHADEE